MVPTGTLRSATVGASLIVSAMCQPSLWLLTDALAEFDDATAQSSWQSALGLASGEAVLDQAAVVALRMPASLG